MSSQKIGRYEIRDELGRGGMATVYRAYDPNFERDVAIKILPEAFLHDPQFKVRFEREAKTIALLEHPTIVPVYDFGEGDGQPFIVMRYMSGGTLNDRLKQGAMTLDETARLISRLAPALDAAHARGIIHRDIKPGNILFDQYGNAYLSDFGIAHLGVEGVTTMTGGSALGTPAYMSPEQIQGDQKVDGRSDIYAMGVLVYQMLTGKTPYDAETPTKVMMMHVLQPVPQILQARPDLPIGCDGVITRAMAKNPNDRFSTAGELAEALEITARYSPGSAATPPPVYTPPVVIGGTTALVPPNQAGEQTMKSPSSVATVAAPAAEPVPAQPKSGGSRGIMIGVVVAIIVFGGLIGLFLLGNRGQGPLAMLAPATISPTSTPTQEPLKPTDTLLAVIIPTTTDTPTPLPSPTATVETTPTITPTQISKAISIGGADKIAYLDSNNIWMANLDGSDRVQITTDGADKLNLQWSEDGNSIYYITGKCIQSVDVETTAVDNVNCFNFTDSFKSFQISPDFKQVAMSLDNQLYLIPFDVDKIRQIKQRKELTDIADCKDFSPYQEFFVQGSHWSRDGKYLAMLLLANLGNGKRGNVIQVTQIDVCTPDPDKIKTFPGNTFTMEGYDNTPIIQNFGFDGYSLFTLNNFVRNDGYGDLYAYNTDLSKTFPKINPINGRCCYRDSEFSPDGSYLLFVYQDFLQGANSASQIYLVPYGSIGTGAEYTPLPLPDITNAREKPQPILRPAKP
jgi:serine/threonine protein kinase